MRTKYFRWVIILGSICAAVLLWVQIHWLKEMYSENQKQVNDNLFISLYAVAFAIDSAIIFEEESPIQQVSPRYFTVKINAFIKPTVLENLIRIELIKKELFFDFQYAIYDCDHDKIVYGRWVNMNGKPYENHQQMPQLPDDEYYFGVYFPEISIYSTNDFWKWTITFFISCLMLILFAGAVWIAFTHRKLAEMQKDFINHVAHEFKTPLSAMQLALDMLKVNPFNYEKYHFQIERQIQRLSFEVNQVLSVDKPLLSKIEAVNAHDCIQDAINKLLETNNLDFDVTYSFDEFMPLVSANKEKLEACFYQLIENAIKYKKPDQKNLIEIITSHQNQKVKITISDHGLGIPKNYKNRIFQAFYRIPSSNRASIDGIGLGLFLVKKWLHSWKGTIKLLDHPQKTIFQITLRHV